MSGVQTGLDRMVSSGFAEIKGHRVGVVCNQATVAQDFVHILDHMLPHAGRTFELVAAFGPQHGLWGHTQDNMIEWDGYVDPVYRVPVYSLYGEHRKPIPEMLEGIDLLIFDVQDIGARYYTFMWTLLYCMEACAEKGIPLMVLDRPNPLGGVQREGTVLDPQFTSFVGLKPLPMRHGLTMGELAEHFRQHHVPGVELRVHHVVNWMRPVLWEETGLPWVPPSPNMPLPETARVYPGMCLFEGTKLSEGRGTTRPFETFGAPFLDGRHLCAELNSLRLPGVFFRPVTFQPTFQKHAGQVCEGGFIHVIDRLSFRPVLTAVAILRQIRQDFGDALHWQDPPYEYEYEKLPIDILAGNTWLREAIDHGVSLRDVQERMDAECETFAPLAESAFFVGR